MTTTIPVDELLVVLHHPEQLRWTPPRRRIRSLFPVVIVVACLSLYVASSYSTEYRWPTIGDRSVAAAAATTIAKNHGIVVASTEKENVTTASASSLLSSSQPRHDNNNNITAELRERFNETNSTTVSPNDVVLHQEQQQGEEITALDGLFHDHGFQYQVSSDQERLFKRLREEVGGGSGNGGATTCSWNRYESQVSQDCIDLLAPIAENVRLWYFLGDSTMARPFRYCMIPKLQNHSQTIKFSTQRSIRKYLGISDDERLPKLNPINNSMGEGPLSYVKAPYQFGCRTCQNRQLRFRKIAPSSSTSQPQDDVYENYNIGNTNSASFLNFSYAEFLTVEYARDVELASTTMATTQHTIARYMQRNGEKLAIPKNQTACILSSGMHDLGIPNITTEMYLRNHVAMKHLLKETGCDIWIRLELTARGYHSPDVGTNQWIFEWNEGIKRATMGSDEYQIELFARSLNAQHTDALHMHIESFYCPLVDFLLRLMMGASSDDPVDPNL